MSSLLRERKDLLGILLTGYSIRFIPRVFSEYWFDKPGIRKTSVVLVVSPLELIRN